MENKFIPGDQVTFINEKQSGTVTKIINAQLVAVDIGDGFEIPTSVKEIVKIQKHSSAEQVQTTAESQKIQPVSENPFTLLKAVPEGTITFCFSPAASGAVNQGDVMGYIVNRTGNDVVFTLLSRKGKRHFGISRGVIEDAGVMETALFTRSELMDTECLVFQGLLFRKGETDASATIRKDIPVVLPGFTEKLTGAEGRFAFSASVLIYQPSLIEPDDLIMLREKLDASALKENMTSRKEKKKVTDHVPEGILLTEKTIDLHIEELVDNASGMSSEEMLKTQLRKFHEEMDLAMRSHLKNIIFIHGIGNGTLKNVIRKELRDYPGVAFRDADARKYGNGATEVMIVG